MDLLIPWDELDRKRRTVLAVPYARDLLDLLRKAPEAPTLRALKNAFPKADSFDETLDKMIAFGWVRRAARRYASAVPDFPFFAEEVSALSWPRLSWKAPGQASLLMTLYAFKPPAAGPLWITPAAKKERAALFSRIAVLPASGSSLISVEREGARRTIADYFSLVAKDLPLAGLLKKVYALIGDVSADYYLPHIFAQLIQAESGSLKAPRRDIFTQSLCIFGLLTISAGRYETRLPVVNEQDFAAAQKSAAMIRALWETFSVSLPPELALEGWRAFCDQAIRNYLPLKTNPDTLQYLSLGK